MGTGPDTEISICSDTQEGWRCIGIPQNVNASDGAYTDRIVISWDSVEQADSYKVYREATYIGQVYEPTVSYSDVTAVGGSSYPYAVTALTMHGEEGALSSSDEGHVNLSPTADLLADVIDGSVPLTVNYDASESYDVDGEIVNYQWDWTSDGTYDFDSGLTSFVSHEYSSVGIYTCTVMVVDNDGAPDTGSIEINVHAPEWVTQTIDNVGNVGIYTSLAIVNGNPAISYYDQTNGNLKYVRAADLNGSSWSTPETLDSDGNVGEYTSIAVVNGRPAVSYYDRTNGDLKYIQASDTNGDTWNAPISIDSAGDVGFCTSLKVVNSLPAIAYHDYENKDLKFVRASDVDGATWSAPQTLDSVGDTGISSSLFIVDSNPAISYYDRTNGDLKYIRSTDSSGSGWDTPNTIDSMDDVGVYCSLLVVNGRPAASYWESTAFDVLFIRAEDSIGGSWGNPITLDSSPSANGTAFTSLALIDSFPATAYANVTNGALMYACANDYDGLSWETPEVVDNVGSVGTYCSLAEVNGCPGIAYYDVTNIDLKFARLQ